ncbi:cytochrome b/b6 domain-containing protein [Albimonas pacifica]|uniref:Cytochrome b561 n=1 Tax=Albimonas pacifica TaxID=1114924 RepID=A0A1I3ED56_9RHOB|nr:cytochrome b/b6 domain-containing protein [Albimonas pacifica]SFH96848.1 cytochrome b561 [Albimonas pacifica]
MIGSGAGAVTLVPAPAETAAHVTQVQRTPGYVPPMPSGDPLAALARRLPPPRRAYAFARRKYVLLQRWVWRLCRRCPQTARRLIAWIDRRSLPEGFDVDRPFNLPYDPWDQRLRAVPDGDFCAAIREGRAPLVTGAAARFTPEGLRMQDGTEVEADAIVTATGLTLQLFGGAALSVDGAAAVPSEHLVFGGMMRSGAPNVCFAIGCTNAAWTLKIGLLCEHFRRRLDHMEATGAAVRTPVRPAQGPAERARAEARLKVCEEKLLKTPPATAARAILDGVARGRSRIGVTRAASGSTASSACCPSAARPASRPSRRSSSPTEPCVARRGGTAPTAVADGAAGFQRATPSAPLLSRSQDMTQAAALSYSPAQKILHWAVVALIALQWLVFDSMGRPFHDSMEAGAQVWSTVPVVHLVIGLTVLALALARLRLRRSHGAPEAPAAEPEPFRTASKWAHVAIYALLLAMPLTGLAAWFGLIGAAAELHEILMNLLLALVFVHVAAVLVHQFVWKTDLLARMK